VATEHEDPLRSVLATVAPGTGLRDGLERILRGNTGALIVIGWDKVVDTLCTGGFPLDVEFSATRLRELCKMDGAVVLNDDGSRILRSATHLMPDPAIPTEESGTRHRTAQRVARQTAYPVISVSQSMRIISLYVADRRYVLERSGELLSRANQAIATLERYKARLDEVSNALSALEIEDLVTVRDAAIVAQRGSGGDGREHGTHGVVTICGWHGSPSADTGTVSLSGARPAYAQIRLLRLTGHRAQRGPAPHRAV
jgi:diadenylate cyclase